jgi:hypothetical protein
MSNTEIYVFMSIGSILFIGSWAILLAVKLQNALLEVARLKKENYDLRTPF